MKQANRRAELGYAILKRLDRQSDFPTLRSKAAKFESTSAQSLRAKGVIF